MTETANAKALVWEDGNLVTRPCVIKDIKEWEKLKKNEYGDKIKTGQKEILVSISYYRNFKEVTQWIPKERVLNG